MKEIHILIDPTLELDANKLKKAWENDPKLRELGRIDARPSDQFDLGVQLLVEVLLTVGVTRIVEGIQEILERDSSEKRPKSLVHVVTLPDKSEAILVEPKPDSDEAK